MFVIVLCMITTSDTSQNSRGPKKSTDAEFHDGTKRFHT